MILLNSYSFHLSDEFNVFRSVSQSSAVLMNEFDDSPYLERDVKQLTTNQ
jgi:hypothetical protein